MSKKDAIDKLLNNRTSTDIQEIGNIEIQEPVNKADPKKKATFDFDLQFHTDLKIYAASRNRSMVDVIVEAVKDYMELNK